VRHLLDVLYTDVGEAAIKAKVVQPLDGLARGAVLRLPDRAAVERVRQPRVPDEAGRDVHWLGAEVVDYPVKAHCCGGHMTQISEEQAFELIRRLLQSAADYRADLILCMCPMCQLNMDAYQGRVNSFFNTNFKLPIVYFTQMLGVALGIDLKKLGFGKELVSAEPVIRGKLEGRMAAAAK
jgi:heterodisulfide reductase subunit B2